LVFDKKEIPVPVGMEMVRTDLSHYAKFLTFELKPSALIEKNRKEPEPDKSFELELWTWNEFEVPTLQRRSRYISFLSKTKLQTFFFKEKSYHRESLTRKEPSSSFSSKLKAVGSFFTSLWPSLCWLFRKIL